ncbi:MAG: (d)CMP kinase [Arenicellales bacterium]|jgi:cytidylate kinase|nr:(d)CMP kinase [Arenicellales bacterium]|tara:strand:- start:87 stop:809 length:723 start_codon:yes stop_codon:yes gene_type:complete
MSHIRVAAVPVLTLDGPSGTGKGTVAAAVAEHTGWHVLDSGALYRAFAFAANKRDVGPDNPSALESVGRSATIEFWVTACDGVHITVDGDDVTEQVRGEAAARLASRYAAVPAVRAVLLTRQRAARRWPGLVADGRDMGTVVFPDATLKVYLTASPSVRAARRYKQLKNKGFDVNLARLESEIAARDEQDLLREASPLVPAVDAEMIDTSDFAIREVVTRVLDLLEKALPGSSSGGQDLT